MKYTAAMNELLGSLNLNCQTLYGHYLDKYFTDLEEPEFTSYELSKIWYLLLVDGLIEEIRERGTYRRLALVQLRRLVDYNSAYYINNTVKLRSIRAIAAHRSKKNAERKS